jgi:hypothetical protein
MSKALQYIIFHLFIWCNVAFGQPYSLDLTTLNPNISSHPESVFANLKLQPFQLDIEKISSAQLAKISLKFDIDSGKLNPFQYINTLVYNHSEEEILVLVRLQGEKWVVGGEVISPKDRKVVQTIIYRDIIPWRIDTIFYGMNGIPGGILKLGGNFDPSNINSVEIVLPVAKTGQKITVEKIWAEKPVNLNLAQTSKDSFFPFIDQFGQYKHEDYIGKIYCDETIKSVIHEEDADLIKNPGPEEWDKYGGWAGGPMFEATGHFRTIKYKGKWWFVTPVGYLFWSHGVDCVRPYAPTPITQREHYFEYLPPRDTLNGELYTKQENAPKGFYQGMHYELVDFGRFNLYRKYGKDYRQQFAQSAHRRLKSWGLNTLGSWSDEGVYLQSKTPYTAFIPMATVSVPISGTSGQWSKFSDPFHPGFEKNIIEFMKTEKEKGTVDDPMCIGYFVDNEISWGDETFLAEGMLQSEDTQPARQNWLEFLQEKYKSVDRINIAWNKDFLDWESVLKVKKPAPPMDNDLRDFNKSIAEKYFTVIREVIKKYAPNKLYLGCRMDFHFYPEEESHSNWLVEIAAKHCDVVSFNRYRYTTEDLLFHDKSIDKPIIIGEVHFCPLDKGLFHSGLRSAKNQDHRKRLYEFYYKGALKNPRIVGVHWFQYTDQPTSGRFDGENYQAGFVNIADIPHKETIEASRNIGTIMYIFRVSN